MCRRIEQFEEQLNAAISRFAAGQQAPSQSGTPTAAAARAAAGSSSVRNNFSREQVGTVHMLPGGICTRPLEIGKEIIHVESQALAQVASPKVCFPPDHLVLDCKSAYVTASPTLWMHNAADQLLTGIPPY